MDWLGRSNMNEPKITAIFVIYNKEIDNSSVCIQIKNLVDVIVVDNSTNKNNNKETCDKYSIKYISMNGNKGLSKAYNVAIDSIESTDAIVLLDDDTDVPEDYFILLKKHLLDYPDTDIIVPIVRGQDGIIYSPNNYRFLKNDLVINPKEQVQQKSFNAISSCMMIRMSVFDDYRFNELLFVDEIDHCFCREQRERGKKFAIVDLEVKQNFHQRADYISPDLAWKRVRIRLIDIFNYARIIGSIKYIILAFVKTCGISIQIGKKSKSLMVFLKAIILSCKLLLIPGKVK